MNLETHAVTYRIMFAWFAVSSSKILGTRLASVGVLFLASLYGFGQPGQALKPFVQQLISASTDEQRSHLLTDNRPTVNTALVQEFAAELGRLQNSASTEERVRVARIALQIAEIVGDEHETANILILLGNALQDNAERRATYRRGLLISEAVEDNILTARFLTGIGIVEENLNRQLEFYLRALTAAEKTDNGLLQASILGRAGNAYTQKGDYVTARQFHSRALVIRKRLNDVSGQGLVYSNLGLVDTMQGDFTAALDNLRSSVKIGEDLKEKDGVGVDLYNLGNVYFLMGDYSQAMTHYLRSLRLFEEIGANGGIEGVATNIANLYNAQGNYEQARVYLNRAARIHDPTGVKLPDYVLGSMADSYKGEGNFQKAIEYYVTLKVKKEAAGNKDDLGGTLADIADTYLRWGDTARAEEYFRQAAALAETTGNVPGRHRSFLGLAKTQIAAKKFSEAQTNARRALEEYGKLKGQTLMSWETHTVLGNAYLGLKRKELAREHLEKAVLAVEEQREAVAGSNSEREAYFRDKLVPYHSMVALSISDNSLSEAFRYAELGKARSLLESIGQGPRGSDHSLPATAISRQQHLKNELVSLRTLLRKEGELTSPNQKILSELNARLDKKRLEFEDLQNRLYVDHPELRINRGEMRPVSIDEAGKLLPDGQTALIEFVVASDQTFVFVLTKDGKNAAQLSVSTIGVNEKDLARRVEAYRSSLAKGDLNFQKLSGEIFNELLKPVWVNLAGKTNLIIVPDGPLWDLPFQALREEKGTYLIQNAAISYAPSLTALDEMSKKAKARTSGPDLELLAFGNPVIGKKTSERVQQVFMRERLEPLPEAERLVSELGKMYGTGRSRIFAGTQAREETAKEQSSNFRIVQFATHGILNNASPMYSHLVLSQDDKNPNEDNLLEAWELKDLDLKADMVILSACETARGRISNGEGVIGMTWAAFIAGSPTTVASQWKVESSSTTELMLEFHRQLLAKKHASKAEALRRASLKLLKTERYRHPVYWAGFVLVGDGS